MAEKIYVLSATEMGQIAVDHLVRRMPLTGLIGLEHEVGDDRVSGYMDFEAYCQSNNLDFVRLSSYGITDPLDFERLSSLEIDLLLVVSWQRLIPDWLIQKCQIGAIGGHGSKYGLSGGRGRSPQNWALMTGADRFELSIFWIDAGIDSGAVIDSATYALTSRDDILSSHFKASWLYADMVVNAWESDKLNKGDGVPQNGDPKYLPQRVPEDGAVDWNRTSIELDAFVRALAAPYPGAFTEFGDAKLVIWQARDLAFPIEPASAPGTVLAHVGHGSFVVATGDGVLMVDDWQWADTARSGPPDIGDQATSVDFRQQMQTIVTRHRAKLPDAELADEILDLADEK